MTTATDILIVGGGIAGLAIAIDLKLRGANVTVLSRDSQQAASHAAAGMLAPGAEGIPPGPMLDLCWRARWLYPEWIRKLETLTGLEAGYYPCGILAPVYELPPGKPTSTTTALWLEREAIHHYQPGLGANVIGGWWHPEDGQVDNRLLMQVLVQAAQTLGIKLREGVAVHALCQRQGKVSSALTTAGEIEAQVYVLATGSWARELLPLPVRPVKGQMLSLRMPQDLYQPLPLQRVLFGPGTYLVPRRDGRLIVGATSEEVSWLPHNTSQGLATLLANALRLYPPLADWPLTECWWGFRPGTPDELPILGQGASANLFLATGHYRNGILLAPVTAALLADLILEGKSDPLLHHFRYDRFLTSPAALPTMNGFAPLSHLLRSFSPSPGEELPPQPATPPESPSPVRPETARDDLTIAGRQFSSRLLTGTGKYPSLEAMQQSIAASGCQIVTVAVRRVQAKAPGHQGLAEALNWSQLWMLPNTAGCQTAEEAVRVARLGREMAKLLGQEDNNFVKLEVIPDTKYLLPDPIGTLQAAEQLVKEGFAVLPYINADPLLAKCLEEIGCATVMPLGSPIGSGQGIRNAANIAIIIEQAQVPVVVDAGIGTPSEAAQAMEMGADALLINSAIALAQNPVAMGRAMALAAEAGRLAYLAGRMPIKAYASASSPLTGVVS